MKFLLTLLVGKRGIYFSAVINTKITVIFEDVPICEKTLTRKYFNSLSMQELEKKASEVKIKNYQKISYLREELILLSLKNNLFGFFKIGHYFSVKRMLIEEIDKKTCVINITAQGFFCLTDFFLVDPVTRVNAFIEKFCSLYNVSMRQVKKDIFGKIYVHPQLFLYYIEKEGNFDLWAVMCLEFRKAPFLFEKNFFFLISKKHIEMHRIYKEMLKENTNLTNELGIVNDKHIIRQKFFGKKGPANYCFLLTGDKLKVGQTTCIDTTIFAYKRSHSNKNTSVFQVICVVYHSVKSDPINRKDLEAGVCRRLRIDN